MTDPVRPPAVVDFLAHYKGDTLDGDDYTVQINSAPADLTDAVIRMQIRNPAGDLLDTFSTENETPDFVITDASAGEFSRVSRIVDVEAGANVYDLEITFQSGDRITFFKGAFPVTQDVTHD